MSARDAKERIEDHGKRLWLAIQKVAEYDRGLMEEITREYAAVIEATYDEPTKLERILSPK